MMSITSIHDVKQCFKHLFKYCKEISAVKYVYICTQPLKSALYMEMMFLLHIILKTLWTVITSIKNTLRFVMDLFRIGIQHISSAFCAACCLLHVHAAVYFFFIKQAASIDKAVTHGSYQL